MPVCDMDLRPGGAYRYVWRKADGAEMQIVGEYREVDRRGGSSRSTRGATSGPRPSTRCSSPSTIAGR